MRDCPNIRKDLANGCAVFIVGLPDELDNSEITPLSTAFLFPKILLQKVKLNYNNIVKIVCLLLISFNSALKVFNLCSKTMTLFDRFLGGASSEDVGKIFFGGLICLPLLETITSGFLFLILFILISSMVLKYKKFHIDTSSLNKLLEKLQKNRLRALD